ncbi:protein ABIL3-like [Diospyros lotus]|uniref:protein ABIL3-like n=1 Tax=Diospyros lotus TaxID=55363 RepID=UPI00224F1C10|nr:protein ABIL3-like [Diospyros lotus]
MTDPEIESSVDQNPEAEPEHDDADNDDSTRFSKSLLELKDLCSQLHYAADHCEASFLNAEQEQKKMVMESTKEYLCSAAVTVVDHLGSVSANLDYCLSKSDSVAETEFRINALKQRLVTCQQYSHKLSLTRLCWPANFPRYHPRYIFPPMPDLERSKEITRVPVALKKISKHELETEEEVPLFLFTCNRRPSLSLTKDLSVDTDEPSPVSVLPVRHTLPVLPKPQNPSFHFEKTRRLKRNMLNWKLVHNNDFFSLIRKGKRAV